LNGQVKPGDSVAIVGAGPVGLATLLTARLYSPAEMILIDVDDGRLAMARKLRATQTINSLKVPVVDEVLRLTGGVGVDVAIEAVGLPETFDVCQQVVAPGGRVANIGVHGKGALLRLEKLWDRNITITTRLVDTASTPMLLKAVATGALDPKQLITHRFRLTEMLTAYDTFQNAGREGALKVVLTR
jgi:alcohol dehydrogenase